MGLLDSGVALVGIRPGPPVASTGSHRTCDVVILGKSQPIVVSPSSQDYKTGRSFPGSPTGGGEPVEDFLQCPVAEVNLQQG